MAWMIRLPRSMPSLISRSVSDEVVPPVEVALGMGAEVLVGVRDGVSVGEGVGVRVRVGMVTEAGSRVGVRIFVGTAVTRSEAVMVGAAAGVSGILAGLSEFPAAMTRKAIAAARSNTSKMSMMIFLIWNPT